LNQANLTIGAHQVGGWLSCAKRESKRALGGYTTASTPVAEALRRHCITGTLPRIAERIRYDDVTGDSAAMKRLMPMMRRRWLDWLNDHAWHQHNDTFSLAVQLAFKPEWIVRYAGVADIIAVDRAGLWNLVVLDCGPKQPIGGFTKAAVLAWLWATDRKEHPVKLVANVWIPRSSRDEMISNVVPFNVAVGQGGDAIRSAGLDTMSEIARPGLHCNGCPVRDCLSRLNRGSRTR